MSRHLKVIATAIVVFLLLSGFSTARGGGSGGGGRGGSSGAKGGGKSGGGGCSSKKSGSHNSGGYHAGGYDDGYDSDADADTGGYDDSHVGEPTGTVLKCVSRTRKQAKVEIRTGGRTEVFVKVDFYGKNSRRLDSGTATLSLKSGVHTIEVPMSSPSKAAQVKRCELAYITGR